MNTLFSALFCPVKAFNQLKTESFSAMSLVIILLLMFANLILMMPVGEKIMQLTMSSMPLNPDQTSMAVELAQKMRYLQIAGTTIMYVVMFLLYALVLKLFVHVSKSRIEYKKIFQLIVGCYLIIAIGDLVNTALLHIRGIDAITNMYDTALTGLNLLTSTENIGVTGYTFLGYINPFQLWFVVLLSIGLKIFADIKPIKAIVISLLFWLITIMLPVLSVYFSQLAMAKTGMI
jgi:hypothetical protein